MLGFGIPGCLALGLVISDRAAGIAPARRGEVGAIVGPVGQHQPAAVVDDCGRSASSERQSGIMTMIMMSTWALTLLLLAVHSAIILNLIIQCQCEKRPINYHPEEEI